MPKRTLILAGGELDLSFAEKYLEKQRFDSVVCADAGLEAAKRLGLSVSYAMGDFDSASAETVAHYRRQQTEFLTYPPEKDATDLHIVLDWVVEQSPSEIVILGATGRRLDHFLKNVAILQNPLAHGIPAYMVDAHNRLYLIDHKAVVRKEEMFGKYISFLPLTECVKNVSLRGFRYDLQGRDMFLNDALDGVSNELADGSREAEITFDEGIMIAVESKD